MRNDDRIRAAAASADSLGDAVRDQGYSRARVLVLVPFKCSAVRIVNAILDACPGAAGDISGYDRFLEEFDIVDEVLAAPLHFFPPRYLAQQNSSRLCAVVCARLVFALFLPPLSINFRQDDALAVAKRVSKRPDDFIELMAGNADDCFRIGIRVNRQNVKLFAPFETSDIIVASPLGLKLVLGEAESKR